MGKKLDLTGQTFGRLTVVSEAGKDKQGNSLWNCNCSCESSVVVRGFCLKSGRTQSCGCLQVEKATTHGLCGHPLHKVWKSMKDRCFNPEHPSYENYGGRGVTVCDRWKDSFENFYNDVVKGYEKGLELDRIDNNGNYEPNNIRWVTSQQNKMNTRSRKNSTSKYKGVSWDKPLSKWKVTIMKDGKSIHLGYFTNETEAALAYNEKAKELFGEYANLNKIGGV